ncbi:MAG: hypothetical protein F4Y80_02415 [Caldilineaceae bacterium SB0665_bin_21]|nr:hypothetical protein [Caldilineaceae bacterium SB0665_bin_21]MYA04908.1 hypothetical protein [Caldilineaceae bacterium SB0664_bin_22]MYC63893.1 hypothetical protein [Caldilineaceae bacterium SB0661_bin_34]
MPLFVGPGSLSRWVFLLSAGGLMGAAMFGGVAHVGLPATDIRPILVMLIASFGAVSGVLCAAMFAAMWLLAAYLVNRWRWF